MPYQIELFANGKRSLRNLEIDESMHSSIGPWEEANQIYIGQSDLENKFQKRTLKPLVIFDIGLGIAANAVALIHATIHQNKKNGSINRDLHLISFENDLQGLKSALNYPEYFPFLFENEDLNEQIKRSFISNPHLEQQKDIQIQNKSGLNLKWELKTGDFKTEINRDLPAPELIYFDFYSPKSSPDLWNYRTFKRLYELTAPKRKANETSTLLTYTSSTAVRSAMILAGFNVGYGIQTDSKRETTIACTEIKELNAPLGQDWINHLKRSSKPIPLDHNFNSSEEAIQEVVNILKQN